MTEAERIEAMFPGKPLLSPEEVARFLEFSRKRVYAMTAAGFFSPPLVVKSGALLLFRKALLADFVEGRPLPSPEGPAKASETVQEPSVAAPVKRGRGRPRKSSLCAFSAHPAVSAVLAACSDSDEPEGSAPRGYWTRRGKVVGRVSGSPKAILRARRSGLRLAVATPLESLRSDWTDPAAREREIFAAMAAAPLARMLAPALDGAEDARE